MKPPVRQAAAIPVRHGRVCLITSRNGRRWVVPKGDIESYQTAATAAAAEAWEEAGLRGTLSARSVGAFEYVKDGRTHHATVFLLSVESVRDDWPERAERTREWVTPEEALRRLNEPGLRDVLRGVFALPALEAVG